MNREEYLKLVESEPDEIKLTDAEIKEWLDEIVDSLELVRKNIYDLTWGKFDSNKGEYEQIIETCYYGDDYAKFHIYKGIGKLAAAVGCKIKTCKRETTDYPIELYFKYRGCRIFELDKPEESHDSE